ncbi:MAG: sulfite exporter TauE/SafE family protein [Eubacteriales bacterium]
MNYIFYSVICLIATTLGAISGIGGGVIIKPVLDATADLTVSQISFLSGCSVLAMSMVSLLSSRGGEAKIDSKRTTPLAIGSALGGVLGKLIFDVIKNAADSDGLVGSAQSVIMILLTGGVLIYVLNKERIKANDVKSVVVCLCIGLVLGILSSFLGIGGGPINLAVLYFFFSMNTKTAALNSIYMIFFAQTASLIFSIASSSIPETDYIALAVMIVSGIIGGFVGRRINKKMSSKAVDILFCCMLVAIIGISVYNLTKYISLI